MSEISNALLAVLTTGLLLMAAGPLAAQTPADTAVTDTFALPGIVVTATRVPVAREALPTPVTVWTGPELADQGIRTVAEALRYVPTATVARAGSPGAQTSLFLRGGESDYVKVLVDGVPVNDPGGAIDLADLSTDQVERIEVVRGPVSVLYGSDAVAGVVQVFTRRAAGAPSVSARILGGRGEERSGRAGSGPTPETYGVYEAEATAAGSVADVSYVLGGARAWSDGLYPINSERTFNTGTARLQWTSGTRARVAVSTRYTDSRSGFPTDGAGTLVDENARLDRTAWVTSANADIRLLDRLSARVQYGLARREQRSIDSQDGPADTLGVYASELAWELTRQTVDARVDWELPDALGPSNRVSAGVAWEQADATSAYSSESAFGPYDADAAFDRATLGYYVQLLSRPIEPVRITLGGRLDDSDTYGRFGTYRAGLSVEPLAGTRLRGAVGRGFKEPTFPEVFGSGFGDVGNPNLDPERSRSWEVGVEQEVGPAVAVATWFDQRFEQMIQYTFMPPAAGESNYYNVGAASARGLELEGRAGVGPVAVTASYTYLETEVLDPGLATDAGFVEGEPLLRRPAHAGNLTARLALDDATVGLAVNAVGERQDLDFGAGFPAPRVTLPSYATLDVSGDYTLPLPGPSTTALLRVENVLDAEFRTIAGFPGTGRVVRVGLRMRVR